jgi:Cu-Zn family superoxide dismutase
MIRMTGWTGFALAGLLAVLAAPADAQTLHATINRATQDGPGAALGTVTITQAPGGAVFKLELKGLPPGPHGFHVHENAYCGPTLLGGIRIPAGAAGRHWDPEETNVHGGPQGPGHLGDLPLIQVEPDGTADESLTAPRIKDITPLKDHALVIQAGGDTYADSALHDGSGGLRFACGAIGD